MENHRFDPLTSMISSDDFPSYNAMDEGIPSSPCLNQDHTDFLPDRLAPLCCAAEGKIADVEIWIMRVLQINHPEC